MLDTTTKPERHGARRVAVSVFALIILQFAATALFLAVGSTIILAVTLGVFLILLSFTSPKTSLVIWLLSVCALPFWLGVHYFTYLPPASLTGLCILIGAFHGSKWRLTNPDIFVFGTCSFAVTLSILGISLPGHGANVLFQWVVAFLIARVLVQKTGLLFAFRSITIVFSITAAFSIIEFITGWNPYYSLSGDSVQADVLASAQARGGIYRSEWAFGHSIALANSLAMAIPIAVASRMNRLWTLLTVALLLGGVIVTFSRSGIFTAIIAVLFVYLFSPSRTTSNGKSSVLITLGVASWFVLPAVIEVFSSASEETSRSAEHRLAILNLIPYLNIFGVADDYTESAGGQFNWHGVISIDNAFLRMGVNFGILLAFVFLVGILILLFVVLSRRGTAPMISVVAVIPALFTVSLITQFGALFWFYVGLVALTWKNKTGTNMETSISEQTVSVLAGHTRRT